MANSFEQITQTTIDAGLATAVISSPIWLQWVEAVLRDFMLVGGAALIIIRLAIIVRHELKQRKKNGKV